MHARPSARSAAARGNPPEPHRAHRAEARWLVRSSSRLHARSPCELLGRSAPAGWFAAYVPWLVLAAWWRSSSRSEEHTSELQSRLHLVCRLLLEKKKK